ncbi:TRAP transporter large permease [Gudongella sp. DL1XJH-153]|uniref:TRAP transporter large permease n=1 Tax=Gudongella sp. DL1XJH-153 TaxID=3409804 RepID=UPI003BB69E7C
MISFILLGSFFGLLLLKVPVAASMGLAALFGIQYLGMDISILPNIFYAAIAKNSLLAIPFFILTGVIMDYSGISTRLIKFANAMIGHRKGGLVGVTVVTSVFFAAISGSGPATVAALGGVLIPAMEKDKYNKNFATALVASSGGIGMIIPPSIPFVIFAMLTGQSVGTMFMAGIIPGLLMGVLFTLAGLWYVRKDKGIIVREKASSEVRWASFKEALWGIMTPVIILGGIYSGIFTATEAAGVSVVYSMFVGGFIYKTIDFKTFRNLFLSAAVSSGLIMYIMGSAGLFAWILTTSGVAGDLSSALLGVSNNPLVLILITQLIFLIAGCFVDSASGFYLLLPILMPVVLKTGYPVYAFGVLATVNFAIGQITPPVGSNLFVALNIAKISMSDLVSKLGYFLLAGIGAILLMSVFPQIITFLPTLLGMN